MNTYLHLHMHIIHVFYSWPFFHHRLQVLVHSGDLQGQLSFVHISWFLKAIALLPREHGAWVIIRLCPFPFWLQKRPIFTVFLGHLRSWWRHSWCPDLGVGSEVGGFNKWKMMCVLLVLLGWWHRIFLCQMTSRTRWRLVELDVFCLFLWLLIESCYERLWIEKTCEFLAAGWA